MSNGKSAQSGISQTGQSCLYDVMQENASCSNYYSFDRRVWCFQNSSLPVYPASQREQRAGSYPRSFSGVYCQTTPKPSQQGAGVCRYQGGVDKQSGQNGIGRVFSKNGTWPKSCKLKYHSPATVCGSKNSPRFIISLYHPMTFALLPVMNIN